MEEEIEVLKSIKNIFLNLKYHGYINDIKKDISTDEVIIAIDNILKERQQYKDKIKELEEENKELKNIANNTQWISPCYVAQNYIPVSLVKEKIEELNNNIDLAIDNSKGGLDEEFIEKGSKMLAQKKILQELLEKRK